jgi:hypothetical protein
MNNIFFVGWIVCKSKDNYFEVEVKLYEKKEKIKLNVLINQLS